MPESFPLFQANVHPKEDGTVTVEYLVSELAPEELQQQALELLDQAANLLLNSTTYDTPSVTGRQPS